MTPVIKVHPVLAYGYWSIIVVVFPILIELGVKPW